MTADRLEQLVWALGRVAELRPTAGVRDLLVSFGRELAAEVLRLRDALQPLAHGSTLRADRERGLGLLGAA